MAACLPPKYATGSKSTAAKGYDLSLGMDCHTSIYAMFTILVGVLLVKVAECHLHCCCSITYLKMTIVK